MKSIEEAVTKKVVDKISGGYGYAGYPYAYPLTPDAIARVNIIKAYHDIILKHEYDTAINDLVKPSVEDVTKILDMVNGISGNKAASAATPPPDKKDIQLEEQGVPVLIEPTNLLHNDAGEEDLKQRNFIIDGINGIDFVQLKSEGVPVGIEPTLLVN